MTTIIKYAPILVFFFILEIAVFASSGSALESGSLPVSGTVPAAVLSPDFTEWQPARPVPVIAAPINDIMMTDGARIFFNPNVVSRTPPKIVAFFLAHEYGHVIGRTSNEFESDRFAAHVYAETDIGVVKAAVWHFYNIQGNQCDQAHGCGWQRAANIAETAGLSLEEYRAVIRGDF